MTSYIVFSHRAPAQETSVQLILSYKQFKIFQLTCVSLDSGRERVYAE